MRPHSSAESKGEMPCGGGRKHHKEKRSLKDRPMSPRPAREEGYSNRRFVSTTSTMIFPEVSVAPERNTSKVSPVPGETFST